MDILFLLVPVSVMLVLVIIVVFAWALHGGQFDNLEREGERILLDGDGIAPDDQTNLSGMACKLARDQPLSLRASEQSGR